MIYSTLEPTSACLYANVQHVSALYIRKYILLQLVLLFVPITTTLYVLQGIEFYIGLKTPCKVCLSCFAKPVSLEVHTKSTSIGTDNHTISEWCVVETLSHSQCIYSALVLFSNVYCSDCWVWLVARSLD